MRGAHLEGHTLRSHGFKIAKNYKFDWITLIVLLILVGLLNLIKPFYRYVGKEGMTDLKFPLHGVTVSMYYIPIVAILLPIIVFLVFYCHKRDPYDLHHAILGLLFSVFTAAVITDVLKDIAGRPRPDFFWRCFPDGQEAYNPVTGNVVCHGDASEIKQGYKSFPSGHTSWSFAGLTFLSLYLSGKIKVFDRGGHVAKLCIILIPLLGASVIGISLIDDYWHHWQDIFAGALIGVVMATLCYRQFFPAPYHKDGYRTYAYARARREAQATRSPTNNVEQRSELPPSVPPGQVNDGLEGHDLESGRV